MKKLILMTIMLAFIVAPALASPSLGWWQEENPRATHQTWDFDPGSIVSAGPPQWTVVPEVLNNPYPASVEAVITADSYDQAGFFISEGDIGVFLEIGNFDDPLAYKEIWIDIGASGVGAPIVTNVVAHDGPTTEFDWILLDGQSPNQEGYYSFGIKIFPNPLIEKIWFTLPNVATSGIATLDWIHVDTICIPAPGAILLGSIGVSFVGWLRRRRTL